MIDRTINKLRTITENKIPPELKISFIRLIYIKDSYTDYSNYRPIAINYSVVIAKIM